VAEDASYAPNEFFAKDGRTIVGMDADLARSLAGAMGLRADVVNASFDSILPGLASGKYDLGISSFTDTKQREKIVDFVTYFRAGTAFFEKSHGGPAVSRLASLCGLRVAVEKGTTQAVDAQAQSAKCTASGHKAVTVEIFPDQGSANLALVSGRADVGMADSPLAYYQAKQSHGALKVVGPTYGTAPYGIAVPKGSGLAPAVLAALKYLMGNGTYKAILDKWGVSNGAVSNPVIDGAQS
jgi:polar amino acid transport system substrate-binding protein